MKKIQNAATECTTEVVKCRTIAYKTSLVACNQSQRRKTTTKAVSAHAKRHNWYQRVGRFMKLRAGIKIHECNFKLHPVAADLPALALGIR